MQLTVGCDPEFFLWDTKSYAYVSAHDKVPGNKEKPSQLPDGSCVQADGMAVEFNIEPAADGKEFIERVRSALSEIRKIVPEQYEFHYEPMVQFTSAVFNATPKEAKELGCDPDFRGIFENVQQNFVPKDIGRYRTGSGHFHIGWTKGADTSMSSSHFVDCLLLLGRFEEFYSGIKHTIDRNSYHREYYYGAPYAFRPKPYGLEYRSPSNAWLRDPKVGGFIADSFLCITRLAAERGQTPTIPAFIAPERYGYTKEDLPALPKSIERDLKRDWGYIR